MPKFSTLLTSYNRPEMLKNAVNSVLKNTYQDWQLLIGDSSSDPEAREAIRLYGEQLANEDKRIIFKQFRVWSEKELGEKCSYAWKVNKLFKLSTGEYITYLTDDDLYAKNYYQSFVDVFDNYPDAKVAYTGQRAYNVRDDMEYTEKDISYIIPAEDIKRNMFFNVDHICVAHERSVFEEVGGWDDDWWVSPYADAEFWYKLAINGYIAYPTGKHTTIKSIHPGAMTQQIAKEQGANNAQNNSRS